MPSQLLGNEVRAPWRPRRASREDEAISTPQMMRVTVTCLVCATEMSCDCSVVRDLGSGPWAEHRSKRPQDEREPSARGESIARLPTATVSYIRCRSLRDTRMTTIVVGEK